MGELLPSRQSQVNRSRRRLRARQERDAHERELESVNVRTEESHLLSWQFGSRDKRIEQLSTRHDLLSATVHPFSLPPAPISAPVSALRAPQPPYPA